MIRKPGEAQEEAKRQLLEARSVEHARLAEIAAEVLKTKDGKALFDHLAYHFRLRGRSFKSENVTSAACPYAAAVRDGEKAVMHYVYNLARAADPTIPIP